MKKAPSILSIALISVGIALPACGENVNKIEILINGPDRCFESNGIPDHPTGVFPNRGNPNAISLQQLKGCVPVNPKRGTVPKPMTGIIGIRRGHSRAGNKNWSLDIFGAPGRLGLDFNNGHVGRAGLYHYHGAASSLTITSGSSLVGYAIDGFEIHYLPIERKSGWRLKKGMRPRGGPPGVYDGTYNEDYQYVGGQNKLDRCNGGEIGGNYAYFITDNFPFVPRCLYGQISPDFRRNRHR